MTSRLSSLVLTILLVAVAAAANETETLLTQAWPYGPYAGLTDVGSGVAVVFSPDLSVPGNCRFYTALGFACFDDADWSRVLEGIHSHNALDREHPIHTLVLETHGTNGNGLKLQRSYEPGAERSYISVGALQERLEPDGVRYILISACNSGRLLRPSIYRSLDPNPGDKLFLNPTCGIISASAEFDPERSRVTIITPASSHIEMTVVGSVGELAPSTRRLLTRAARAAGTKPPGAFAISDLMMQMLTHDRRLSLRIGAGVDALSRAESAGDVSESLFRALIHRLNQLGRQQRSARSGLDGVPSNSRRAPDTRRNVRSDR